MKKKTSGIIFISLSAALGGLLFGFDFAIFSGTIPFIKPAFGLTDAQLGWTGSSIYIGCIAGTLITGYLADRFGRKLPLALSAIVFAISSVMMGWAPSYNTLIIWRIIAGIAVGAASILSPLYISEISPAAVRGKLVALNQLTIVTGILLAYLTSYLLADAVNNWRWMFSAATVPAIFFFICALTLPESPRWLLLKGEREKARKILNRIAGPEAAEEEIRKIRPAGSPQTREKRSDLFKPGILLIVLTGIAVAVFQQISGANVVFVYAPLIFERAGMNVKNQLFQQVLIGCVNLVFTLVAMRIVDTAGRRKMMIIGAAGMFIMLGLIGAAFYYNWLQGPWVTLLTLLFIAIYATTLAPVTWVLISEIFPNRIRGIAMSAATTMLWVACFAVTYTFPLLISYFQDQTYITFLIFSGICFIYFLFLLKYIPETKNKTLEQIEAELVG